MPKEDKDFLEDENFLDDAIFGEIEESRKVNEVLPSKTKQPEVKKESKKKSFFGNLTKKKDDSIKAEDSKPKGPKMFDTWSNYVEQLRQLTPAELANEENIKLAVPEMEDVLRPFPDHIDFESANESKKEVLLRRFTDRVPTGKFENKKLADVTGQEFIDWFLQVYSVNDASNLTPDQFEGPKGLESKKQVFTNVVKYYNDVSFSWYKYKECNCTDKLICQHESRYLVH